MQEGIDDDRFTAVCEFLKQASAALNTLRGDCEKKRRAKLVDEIWAAHERGDFATMHALRIQYQRNGRGPKRRYYFDPRTHWPQQQWQDELAKPAAEGGMSGRERIMKKGAPNNMRNSRTLWRSSGRRGTTVRPCYNIADERTNFPVICYTI